MNYRSLSLCPLLAAALTFGAGCGSSDSANAGDAGSCPTGNPDPGAIADAASNGDSAAPASDGGAAEAAVSTTGFPFSPSNVAASAFPEVGDVTVSAASCVADTDKRTIDCVNATADGGTLYTFTTSQQSDGSTIALLALKSLAITQAAQLTVKGSLPLVIWAQTTVNIQGALFGSPDFRAPNGGGAQQTPSGTGGGPGGGAAASADYIGGGGGGYCGIGGTGANSHTDAGSPNAGGRAYGDPSLAPLLAGSSGGGQGAGLEGGEGGGAVQISAGTSILIGTAGAISMPGYGATGNGGGGGSGGALLLEAPAVTINGILAANGGGAGVFEGGGSAQSGQPTAQGALGQNASSAGGSAGAAIAGPNGTSTGANATSGGGGGAGRIRVNTTSGQAVLGASALVSPSASTTCFTQGAIKP